MARNRIPDPLARRHAIEGELPQAQALAIAEAYLEEGRALEAVDFLAKGEAAEQLASLRGDAIAAGDLFLLRAVGEAQDAPPSKQEWLALAQAAEAAGMERYAADARRLAERGEE